MDPKQSAQQLDPKLQQAYDRVMGMKLDPAMPPTTPTTPVPDLPITPVDMPMPTTPMDMPGQTPTMPTTPPAINPQPDVPTTPTPTPVPLIPEPQPNPLPSVEQALPTTPHEMPQEITAKPHEMPQETVHFEGASAAKHTEKTGKKMTISPVILILGGIVFFLVYTLIWVKVFNLNLPIPFLGK
ncbi:MAG: hypothetical protein ACREGI_03660 [Candidatus Levyibacteriota bacterium]